MMEMVMMMQIGDKVTNFIGMACFEDKEELRLCPRFVSVMMALKKIAAYSLLHLYRGLNELCNIVYFHENMLKQMSR